MSGSHRPSHGFVHLKGAIQHPGIYPVKENTRWDEVVKAAGGLTAAADIQQVNLAKIASDQESLYVPEKGETSTATAPPTTAGGTSATGKPAQTASGAVVDLNKADVAQLTTISGIGPKRLRILLVIATAMVGSRILTNSKKFMVLGIRLLKPWRRS